MNKDKTRVSRGLVIMVVIAFMATMLIGAQFQGCQRQQKPEQKVSGLDLSFVENAPPQQVEVMQKFPVYVDVNNNGNFDVAAGKAIFYLVGVGDNIKNINKKLTNSNTLKANVGMERLIFANEAYSDLPLTNQFLLPLQLVECYDYATITQLGVCVAKQDSAICSLQNPSVNNARAPVQVTSVKEEVKGSTLFVYITFGNKVNGNVYNHNADCDKIHANDINEMLKKDKMKITIMTEQGFSCLLQDDQGTGVESVEGFTTLGTLTCKKHLSDEQPHITNFRIVTEYKYVQSVTKQLTILPNQ